MILSPTLDGDGKSQELVEAAKCCVSLPASCCTSWQSSWETCGGSPDSSCELLCPSSQFHCRMEIHIRYAMYWTSTKQMIISKWKVSTKVRGNFHNISRKLLQPLLLVKVRFRSMWTSILISGRDHGLLVEIQSRVSTFVYKNIFLSLIVKMLVIFRKFREILLTPSGE